LAVGALIVIFPFYYMIAASFMSQSELDSGMLFSQSNIIENIKYNYSETFNRLNFMAHIGNTLLVAVTTTTLQLLVTILSAFAFSRLTFRGRDTLFMIFLSTMMIPGEMFTISNYITMSNLKLAGNSQTIWQAYLTMILPFISSVFYIYLLRQNFKQIPNELYLAAKVDGKSDWEYLWKVMVPLAAPTLITVTILSIIGSWNAYAWPNLVVSNQDAQIISVIIRSGNLNLIYNDTMEKVMTTWQMTASVLTVVPLLILFIIFRKYIMRGTSRAGIKG
jgi:multiple sugar transport system permease protein